MYIEMKNCERLQNYKKIHDAKNAKNTKTEFLGSIKNELKTYLDKIDVSKEIDRVIENYDVEVNAKVSFKKKKKAKSTDDGLKL
jgi:myosin-crossreactive antigen